MQGKSVGLAPDRPEGFARTTMVPYGRTVRRDVRAESAYGDGIVG